MNVRNVVTATRSLAIAGSLGALFVLPTAACADPPAVGAPTIPAVFVGAPTNDNPNAGEFTVNLDSTGQYLGTGTAAEPPLTRDLVPAAPRVFRQARVFAAAPSAAANANVDRVFDRFKEQLRENGTAQTASR